MKIVAIDNFSRESFDYPDKLIAENVEKKYVLCMIDALNEKFSGRQNDWFFIAVDDDFKLRNYSPV